MTERPISFNGEMVRALLDGRKTQTRRIISDWMCSEKFTVATRLLDHPEANKFPGADEGSWMLQVAAGEIKNFEYQPFCCPYGKPGDRLWVREAYYQKGHWEPVDGVLTRTGRQKWRFVADSDEIRWSENPPSEFRKGRHHKDPATSIWHKRLGRFMPKAIARTWLVVNAVRVEQLQAISEEDAISEGVEKINGDEDDWKDYHYGSGGYLDPRESFLSLWASINGNDSVTKNPWVWVVEFARLEGGEA